MEAYVAKNPGWVIVRRYLLPETRSSEIEKAEEFQTMLREAKGKSFEVLLIHKLDRFGRDRDTSVVHKAMLRRLGIQVRSVQENLGDGIMDRAMEGILEVMAEWYGANLGQETRKGHRQLTRKGFWTGGKVPFGYQVETVQDGSQERRRLVPSPTDGPIMEEVFNRLAAGELTGDVLKITQYRTGKAWIYSTLVTRVKNPIYYGLVEYGQTTMPQGRRRRPGDQVTEGSIPPIVSKEIWEAANQAIHRRKGRATSRKSETYTLSGLGSCQRCGGAIVGGWEGGEAGGPRYSCSNRRGGGCTYSSVGQQKFESVVLSHLAKYLGKMNATRLVAAYEKSLGPIRAESAEREKRLRRELNSNREKTQNLVRAIESGLCTAEIRSRLRVLEQEAGELAEAIATCELDAKRIIHANTAIVGEWLERVMTQIETGTPSDIALLLRHVVRFEVDLKERQGQLAIQLPLSEPASRFELPHGQNYGRSARI